MSLVKYATLFELIKYDKNTMVFSAECVGRRQARSARMTVDKKDEQLKRVKTGDGSVTYHDSEFDETYHSNTGAKEEADKKYALACGIDSMDAVEVLDICFGLGYNTAAAIDLFKGKRIKIVALENYQGIIDEIINLVDNDEYPFSCSEMMKQVAKTGKYDDGRVTIELIMGDALETIKYLDVNRFEVVFLDPFSPKRCPPLWTEEFFKDIHHVMKKSGVVATYSCAGQVRRNFEGAGFKVSDGPTVGRRSHGTLAQK